MYYDFLKLYFYSERSDFSFTNLQIKLLERGLCYGYNRIGVWFIYEIVIL